jgi:hypothetical protein
MKKIFAICAVAFVAAAMFTSCNKPEENSVTVKFNKEQWTAQQVLGNEYENLLGMEAYETSFSDSECASVAGTLATAVGSNTNFSFFYQENAADTTADGDYKWGVAEKNQEINAIDLAAHTVDATVEETLKQEGKDDAELKITMTNAVWTLDPDIRPYAGKCKARRR